MTDQKQIKLTLKPRKQVSKAKKVSSKKPYAKQQPDSRAKASPEKFETNKKRNFSEKKSDAPKQPAQKIPLDSRHAAYEMLNAIIHRGQMLDSALVNNQALDQLDKRDRAFCRLLVTSCLRRYGQLTTIIDRFVSDKTPEPIRIILHIGAVQLLFLNSSPHAATDTSVELARTIGYPRQTGVINAVMRSLIREKDEVMAATDILDNLPFEIRTRWLKAWGEAEVTAITHYIMTPPPLDITAAIDPEPLAQKLGGRVLFGPTIRCMFDGDIRQMADYEKGVWWVQDVAASLPARLMGSVKGKKIWDLCAAPGGKTAQLITAGGDVLAIDYDQRRLEQLNRNLERLNLEAETMLADVLTKKFADFANTHTPDMILLDAPCSSTGTIRRRPDILVRPNRLGLGLRDKIQREMLQKALGWVHPDGLVLYATCSLEPEEGEQIIEDVLNNGMAQIIPFTDEELGLFAASRHKAGWARILPTCLTNHHFDIPNLDSNSNPDSDPNSDPNSDQAELIRQASGNDGFFIARLRPNRS